MAASPHLSMPLLFIFIIFIVCCQCGGGSAVDVDTLRLTRMNEDVGPHISVPL